VQLQTTSQVRLFTYCSERSDRFGWISNFQRAKKKFPFNYLKGLGVGYLAYQENKFSVAVGLELTQFPVF
jgi:hypothetical protein